MLEVYFRHLLMLLYKIKCPGDLLLHFNSLLDKEIREIRLEKDDCPPSFVFNHSTKIRSVALKCNYIFSKLKRDSVRRSCRRNLHITSRISRRGASGFQLQDIKICFKEQSTGIRLIRHGVKLMLCCVSIDLRYFVQFTFLIYSFFF